MRNQTYFSTIINFNQTIYLDPGIRYLMQDTINLVNNLSDFHTIAATHFDQFDELHFRLDELRGYTVRFIETISSINPDHLNLSVNHFNERYRSVSEYARLVGILYDNTEVLINEFWKLYAHYGDRIPNSRFRNILTQDLERLTFPHRQLVASIRRMENLLRQYNPHAELFPNQWWEQEDL